MEPLRIGVLGAGLIGRRHIATIVACPDAARLVGVADPAVGADAFAGIAAPFFRTHEELLDAVRPDAVVIATPNQVHAAQGLACCQRGIDFLVEKPVTATLDEAAALVRAVRTSGVRTLVGHHRRYLASVQTARRLIADGRIGPLVAASVLWATRKPDRYYDAAWRRQPGGGPILINAIHEIDLLRHLCGEITAVVGTTSRAMRGFEVEDTAAALLRFAGGCVGTLTLTDAGLSPWTIEQGTAENPAFAFTHQSSYRLVGAQGSLELPVLRLWTPRIAGEAAWDRPIVGDYLACPEHDPFIEQLRHFQRLVRLGEAPVVSVEDGARTLAATLAIAQSAAREQPVDPFALLDA